jgi:hypothetical protein
VSKSDVYSNINTKTGTCRPLLQLSIDLVLRFFGKHENNKVLTQDGRKHDINTVAFQVYAFLNYRHWYSFQ